MNGFHILCKSYYLNRKEQFYEYHMADSGSGDE